MILSRGMSDNPMTKVQQQIPPAPPFISRKILEISLHEAHFMPLRNQSNIYGVLNLYVNGSNKLVVTTLRGEVYSLEFHDPLIQRPPSFKSITFSYIPVGVELVSIDAIVKEPNGVIIGITLIKTDTEPHEAYFNLYGIHSNTHSTFQWEKIAGIPLMHSHSISHSDDWQPLNLKYMPFQVTNTKILAGDHWEPVFLVSGDDLKVHVYREVNISGEFSFQEDSLDQYFPEFHDLPSSVTCMDIRLAGMHRLTALGCQGGHLRWTLVDLTSNVVVKMFTSNTMDGPLTSIKLFTSESEAKSELRDYHLLVCSAIELGAVFLNVMEDGFSHSLVLPSSHLHDSILCSTVADLNWDGRNELVLGTYGKKILVYKFNVAEENASAELVWTRNFSHPIHNVWYGDLTRDGVNELAVVSMGGVHILQHDLNQVSQLCVKRAMDILNVEER